MRTFLTTDRLVLRRFSEADIERLVELDSDPEVMRFINGGRPTSREEVRNETLPRLMRRYGCLRDRGFHAAEDRATREFLGWFALRPVRDDSAEVAELGYRLRRSVWGRGYATEGARALVRKGFAELGVRRVVAQTMTVNRASRRVMEKAGLRYVRTFFVDWPEVIEGTEHGDVEYALTLADWSEAARAG